jgi:hypothetical protein
MNPTTAFSLDRAMLQPVVALAAWTLIMLLWMFAQRMPALRKAGVQLGGVVGGRGADADKVLPPPAQWAAHNYNHLLEQPTIFYALALVLALTGPMDFYTRMAAWAYVTLRIVHSIWQAAVNRVSGRFLLFLLSTLLLFGLAGRALYVLFRP